MRTVLFLVESSYRVGGLQTRYANLGRVLPRAGWRAVYALTRGNHFHDPRRLDDTFGEFETIELDARTGTWDGRVLAVERALRKIEPDVFVPLAGLDAWYVSHRRKRAGRGPRIACGLPGVHPRYIALLRRFMPIVDAAYGVSPLTARILSEVARIPSDRVFSIATGVPIHDSERELRTMNELRIGFVGRLSGAHKRAGDLIPLCAALAKRNVPFILRIIGEGPLENELRRELEPYAERIRFEGALTNEAIRRTVMPELDVCVILSETEGTPNTALEAMASGAVVVTSDFAGREEQGLLRHGETALVFPVGAVDEAAALLAALASDPGEQQRIARNARDQVKEKHDLEAMGREFARMLDRACEGAPANGEVDVPAIPLAGRLTRLFGSASAEAVRRLLGRRFPHPDASEWPAAEGITVEETAAVVADLERVLGFKVDENQ